MSLFQQVEREREREIYFAEISIFIYDHRQMSITINVYGVIYNKWNKISNEYKRKKNQLITWDT